MIRFLQNYAFFLAKLVLMHFIGISSEKVREQNSGCMDLIKISLKGRFGQRRSYGSLITGEDQNLPLKGEVVMEVTNKTDKITLRKVPPLPSPSRYFYHISSFYFLLQLYS